MPVLLRRIVRYALALLACWVAFPAEALLVYALLVLYAAITGDDSHGQAGPFMVTLAVLVGTLITIVVVAPAAALAVLVARGRARWRKVAVTAVTSVVLLGVGAVVWARERLGVREVSEAWGLLLAITVLPLVVFLLLTHGARALARSVGGRSSREPETGVS